MGVSLSLSEVLAKKPGAVGFWLSTNSPLVADSAASSFFDWAAIDAEHSPAEVGDILSLLRCFDGSSVAPVIRLSSLDQTLIKKTLDMGALNLMAPMVQTREDAKRFVSFSSYPPIGVRGVAGSMRANDFGRNREYLHTANEQVFLIAQIETPQAVGNISEIAQVDGISALFIGPSDLSASMGRPGEPDHDDVQAVIATAFNAAKTCAKPVGVFASSIASAQRYAKLGFDFIALCTDASVLRSGMDASLSEYKKGVSPE